MGEEKKMFDTFTPNVTFFEDFLKNVGNVKTETDDVTDPQFDVQFVDDVITTMFITELNERFYQVSSIFYDKLMNDYFSIFNVTSYTYEEIIEIFPKEAVLPSIVGDKYFTSNFFANMLENHVLSNNTMKNKCYGVASVLYSNLNRITCDTMVLTELLEHGDDYHVDFFDAINKKNNEASIEYKDMLYAFYLEMFQKSEQYKKNYIVLDIKK